MGSSRSRSPDQLDRDRQRYLPRDPAQPQSRWGLPRGLGTCSGRAESSSGPRSSSSTTPGCAPRSKAWMDDGWSPKLIAEVLARDHPDDRLARVSHETIYKCLYVQGRGQLRADLHKCLSTKTGQPASPGAVPSAAGSSTDVIHHQRASRRGRRPAVPGHWEGDLILGSRERQCDRHPGRAQHPVHHLVAPARRSHRRIGGRSDDRGDERAAGSPAPHHHLGPRQRDGQLAVTSTCSCRPRSTSAIPHSPWQRGSNENTNRLLAVLVREGHRPQRLHQSRPQTRPRHTQQAAPTHPGSRHPSPTAQPPSSIQAA